MTAVNIFLHENAVHMMTDGAAYDADCRLQRRTQKTYALPHLRMVIATRGKSYLAPLIAMVIEAHCETFDEVVAKIGDLLKHHVPLLAAEIGYTLGDDVFDFMAAGIADDGRPAAFGVTSAGGLAWQVQPVVDVLVSPSDEDFRRDVAMPIAMMARCQGRSELEFDPAIEGVRLMEAQRLYFAPTRIGAFMQLTTIEARGGGIRSDIVKFWPDKPGEIIGGARPRQLLATENGAIKNLSIQTLKLGDNAVTVAEAAYDPGGYPAGTWGACTLSVPINTNGLIGKPMKILINGKLNIVNSGTSGVTAYFSINKDSAGWGNAQTLYSSDAQGIFRLPFAYVYNFTITANSHLLRFRYTFDNGPNADVQEMVLSAIACKR